MICVEKGTFKEVIIKLISPIGDAIVCIKHCYRGNPSGGRLWTVWGNSKNTWIEVVQLKHKGNNKWEWTACMEKNIPEDNKMVDCPLKYLDIVPCPKDINAVKWREKVYQYHNERVAKRLKKKEAEKSDIKVLQEKAEKLKNEAEKYVNSIEDFPPLINWNPYKIAENLIPEDVDKECDKYKCGTDKDLLDW